MDADTKSAFIAFLVVVILLSLGAVIELYIVAIKKGALYRRYQTWKGTKKPIVWFVCCSIFWLWHIPAYVVLAQYCTSVEEIIMLFRLLELMILVELSVYLIIAFVLWLLDRRKRKQMKDVNFDDQVDTSQTTDKEKNTGKYVE